MLALLALLALTLLAAPTIAQDDPRPAPAIRAELDSIRLASNWAEFGEGEAHLARAWAACRSERLDTLLERSGPEERDAHGHAR